MRFEDLCLIERGLSHHNMIVYRDVYSLRHGIISDNKVAMVGGAGHLFIAEGGNGWHSQLCGNVRFSTQRTEAWLRVLHERATRAKERGIELLNLVVPEKQIIMSAFLGYPTLPKSWEGRPIARIIAAIDREVRLIYPVNQLREAQPIAEIFWRGNSHWCASGCVVTAQALIERFGLLWSHDLVCYQRSVKQHDLFPHLNIQAPYEEVIILSHSGAVTSEFLPFASTGKHEGSSYVIYNEKAPNSGVIAIFGDSYSFDNGLAYCLSSFFRETHYIWSKSIDWKYVDEKQASFLLWECAERFLLTPSDE